MSTKATFIKGGISFQSAMRIDEVGEFISTNLFGGLKFQGLEKEIYGEIPAIFIATDILGLTIILSGHSGFNDECFTLDIYPMNLNYRKVFGTEIEYKEYIIDDYLEKLISYYLKDNDKIQILKSEAKDKSSA